jgi:hypothetical protein
MHLFQAGSAVFPVMYQRFFPPYFSSMVRPADKHILDQVARAREDLDPAEPKGASQVAGLEVCLFM